MRFVERGGQTTGSHCLRVHREMCRSIREVAYEG